MVAGNRDIASRNTGSTKINSGHQAFQAAGGGEMQKKSLFSDITLLLYCKNKAVQSEDQPEVSLSCSSPATIVQCFHFFYFILPLY